MSSEADEPVPRKLTFKKADFTAVNEPAGTPPGTGLAAATDTLEILRVNREREQALGFDKIAPAPSKQSRRLRDYFVTMIVVNLLAVLAVWLVPGTALFAFAGALIFSGGFTWVMLIIMEDY